MRIRLGFISNSSSSSFILDNRYSKEEILDFVKEEIVIKTGKKIEESRKTKFPDNWEEYIKMLLDDLKNLDTQIDVKPVKEYQAIWDDLQEFHNMENIKDNDLVLFDMDDNYVNWVTDKILERFEVKSYCEHM